MKIKLTKEQKKEIEMIFYLKGVVDIEKGITRLNSIVYNPKIHLGVNGDETREKAMLTLIYLLKLQNKNCLYKLCKNETKNAYCSKICDICGTIDSIRGKNE